MGRMAGQLSGQRLERDHAPEATVPGEVHASHAATSELSNDRVGAERVSFLDPVVLSDKRWQLVSSRFCEEGTGGRVMFEQRQHLLPGVSVDDALAIEPRENISGVLVHGPFEQCSNTSPGVVIHEDVLTSSRKSQALASAHRRFSVAADMPSASAVSSMLNPTKYRSSTIRACSASMPSRRVNASSRAGSIASWSRPLTRDSVRETRSMCAQRFCAPRARARSTRICLMDRAAMARKCFRSVH